VANVRLCSKDDSYVIAVEFWAEVLGWALENGWKPEHEQLCYRGEFEFEVEESDASNLADSLEFIAGDIVLHEYEVPDDFLKHLLDSLLKLEVFFRGGEFKIVPLNEKTFE
jgi:hypothetical protein